MKDVIATIIINTKGKTEEELFRNIEYSRRKNIKRALVNQLVSVENFSEEDLKKSYDIYEKTILDGGTSSFSYEDWIKFIDLKNNKFFIIKQGDKIIGCYGFKEITKRLFHMDSDEKGIRATIFANDLTLQHLRPNDFMYWEFIKEGLKNGYCFVDLGGWQIKPREHLVGVNKFKEQWGGEVLIYKNDYSFLKAISRKLVRNFYPAYWINNKIRQIGVRKLKMKNKDEN